MEQPGLMPIWDCSATVGALECYYHKAGPSPKFKSTTPFLVSTSSVHRKGDSIGQSYFLQLFSPRKMGITVITFLGC